LYSLKIIIKVSTTLYEKLFKKKLYNVIVELAAIYYHVHLMKMHEHCYWFFKQCECR